MLSGFSGNAMDSNDIEKFGEPKKAEFVRLIQEKYKFSTNTSGHALENVVDKLLLRPENSREYRALMDLQKNKSIVKKSITRRRRSHKKEKDDCTTDTVEKKDDLAPILMRMLGRQAESSDKSYKFQVKATVVSWVATIIAIAITAIFAVHDGEPGGCFLNNTLNSTII